MTPQKKKILYVITKSNFGGAQKYVFDLATNLPKETYESVVAFGPAQGSDAPGMLAQLLKEKGIRTIFIPSLGRAMSLRDFKAFFDIRKVIRDEHPDVVHLNSSKIGGLGALAARMAGIPHIIFTAHGWPFLEKRSFVIRSVIFALSYITLLLAHTTICISEYDKKIISRLPFAKSKIHVIHNGLASLTFLSREEARKELLLPDDAFVVGSIGELTKNKNFSLLMEAVSKLPKTDTDTFLDIIGDGEERDHLAVQKNDLGLSGTVLEGFKADAYRYLRAYDVFVLPSLKEGLPYVLLEAAIAGIPVVATDVGGVREIIEDAVTGILIPSNDSNALVMALVQYRDNTDLRALYGNALQMKVIYNFTADEMFKKTLSLYEK